MFNVLKISKLIERKKISKIELSKLIDKNENTIQNYLTEKTKIDVYTLEKIANVLEVPISYFFDEGNNHIKSNSNNAQMLKEIEYLKEIIKQKDEIINLLKYQLKQ